MYRLGSISARDGAASLGSYRVQQHTISCVRHEPPGPLVESPSRSAPDPRASKLCGDLTRRAGRQEVLARNEGRRAMPVKLEREHTAGADNVDYIVSHRSHTL